MPEKLPCGNNLEEISLLFEEYYLQLVGYAQKFVSGATAEDIVQDIFVDLHRKREQLNIESARSYLFRSVHNRCLDHIKHQAVHKRYLNHASVDLALNELNYFDPDKGNASLLLSNDLEAVQRAIDQLSPKCKEIICLKYFDELGTKEIAQLLNISSRTVETQLYKAVKQVRGMVRKLSYLFTFPF